MTRDVEAFLAMLFRVRADGTRVYGDDVLTRLVPILHLLGDGSTPPSPALEDTLAAFNLEAGIGPGMDRDAVMEAVERWIATHPIPAELRDAIQGFVVERRTVAGGKAAAFVGAESSAIPVGARAAPPGATKGGPMARFKVQRPGKGRKH